VIEFWRNQTYSLNYLPPLLNQTVPSQYNTSTLMLTIIENIMIEEWSKEVSYSKFFDQCHPSYCIYSVNERPSAIFIITTVIGIFSGLNVVLKLLTPLILRGIYWCWGHTQGMFRDLILLESLVQMFSFRSPQYVSTVTRVSSPIVHSEFILQSV